MVKSPCIYCGCGCILDYQVEKNRITKVLPVKDDEVSEGRPCIKGLTIHEVYDKNRITKPMIRKMGRLTPVSLDEAVDFIYKKIKNLPPDEIFLNGSGKTTNENNYAALKFARGVLKTTNTDSCCGRLCHAATVQGMADCFGQSNITLMKNIDKIDTLLVIGSNPFGNYPTFFSKIKKTKLVNVQNILNFHAKEGDITLVIKPGSEVALLNGIVNELIKKGAKSSHSGFLHLKQVVSAFDRKIVCGLCGIGPKDYLKVVEAVRKSKKFGVMHGMGFTQHVNAIENVHSLLNLVILKNAYIQTLRGEINVQGAGDIGFYPNALPSGGYETLGELERKWKTDLCDKKGKTAMEALAISPVKAAFIIDFNPAQSMPALNRVHKILTKMFVVVMSPSFNETCRYADVIIPVPLLLETEGSITNGEKRVRKASKVIDPPAGVVDEWQFFKKLSAKLNSRILDYRNPRQITEEITETVPAYSKIDVRKLYEGKDQWADKKIKFRQFVPEKYEGVDEIASKKYPFILTTFRSQFQFLTGEQTRESETLRKMDDGPCFYISKSDADKMKIKDGDKIMVTSEEGRLKAPAKLSDAVPPGLIAARFHYHELLINKLFPLVFDEETFTPSYKAVAVRIRKSRY
ncbi:MAG: molybdopterin-dependent oxidoreductase [Candidatus Micrarchaeota archaeon]